MTNLTAALHEADPDEGGYWATCLEVSGANGQGETKEECLEDLAEAVKLMVESHKERAMKADPRAEITPLAIA